MGMAAPRAAYRLSPDTGITVAQWVCGPRHVSGSCWRWFSVVEREMGGATCACGPITKSFFNVKSTLRWWTKQTRATDLLDRAGTVGCTPFTNTPCRGCSCAKIHVAMAVESNQHEAWVNPCQSSRLRASVPRGAKPYKKLPGDPPPRLEIKYMLSLASPQASWRELSTHHRLNEGGLESAPGHGSHVGDHRGCSTGPRLRPPLRTRDALRWFHADRRLGASLLRMYM